VQVTQAACWGSSERFLGLLASAIGRWGAAATHFEAAIAKNESIRCPGAASLVRRDYAKMLVARSADGDLDHAADLLCEPLKAAKALGIESLITRIQSEVELVERERRATPDRLGRLTRAARTRPGRGRRSGADTRKVRCIHGWPPLSGQAMPESVDRVQESA
jgi:hypothetical protein